MRKTWTVEVERMICLGQHDWWAHRPRKLRETVRNQAEANAEREGKTSVYQQHVLRAAAEVAEETNNTIYWRRRARRSSR